MEFKRLGRKWEMGVRAGRLGVVTAGFGSSKERCFAYKMGLLA